MYYISMGVMKKKETRDRKRVMEKKETTDGKRVTYDKETNL